MIYPLTLYLCYNNGIHVLFLCLEGLSEWYKVEVEKVQVHNITQMIVKLNRILL